VNYPVIKAASNILVHTPTIMLDHGSTLVMEKARDAETDFLKNINSHLRNFEQAVSYPPNQVFIGNITPSDLKEFSAPWYENPASAEKNGKFGRIVSEPLFYGALKICDKFDLVDLTADFAGEIKQELLAEGLFPQEQLAILDNFKSESDITALIEAHKAIGIYHDGKLVGCVHNAHDSDPNLKAEVVLENLACKASGVIAINFLLQQNNIDPRDIDYIIETSEEAIGDINQRGGGNLAKACGEIAGCTNATGIDMRGFCAGPAHGIVNAAALVQAGIFQNILVMAGGSVAKLGMNSREHVKKGVPVLEDMIAGYAILISANDGHYPRIRTDIVGRHKIGSGSSPQAVIQSIIVDPLLAAGLNITDIDLFAPELQNPEITVPAGAGDVPMANYKMIGAMAVKRGEIEKHQLLDFVLKHGVTGFAPTQGHIPSGIPVIGHILQAMHNDEWQKVMIIGKGSLFLGRMTNLFDGISFVIEKNPGLVTEKQTLSDQEALKEEIREFIAEAMGKVAQSLTGR